MKINIGKLVRVASKIVVAAPVVIAAIRPVADALKKPNPADKSTGQPTAEQARPN